MSARFVRYAHAMQLLLLSLWLASPAWPNALTPVRRLEVVDATETVIGEAHILAPTEIIVLLSFNNGADIVALPVEPDGFRTSVFALGFTTSNCTGQAYLLDIHRYEAHWLPLGIITEPGHTLWVREQDATLELVTLGSILEDTCRGFYYEDIWTLRARAVVDLATLYTPPFRLRVFQRPLRR